MLTLGSAVYSYQDFTEPVSGKTCAVMDTGIVGMGSGSTIIDLVGPVGTQFPTWKQGDTTRFDVIRIQGTAQKPLGGVVLKGFTLRVSAPLTAQMLFNGLLVQYCAAPVIEDLVIVGIQGEANGPPWETFGLDLSHCTGPSVRGVMVDGQKKSAAGIGTNNCTGGLIDSCQAVNSLASHGFAHWQSSGITHVGCIAGNNGTQTGKQAGAGFSHEECSNMTHIGSLATGNSLASFRYRGTAASTQGHYLIRSNGDGALRLEKKQRASDIEDTTSVIMGGLVQA